MMSQTEQQIITIHILPNILRIKSSETTKFGQLINFNVKNIFHENETKK